VAVASQCVEALIPNVPRSVGRVVNGSGLVKVMGTTVTTASGTAATASGGPRVCKHSAGGGRPPGSSLFA